jgi:SAM-dependent methyltransferase
LIDLAGHHKRLAAYYEPLLAEHGNHYRGVGWVTEHLQTVRFEVLSGVGDLRHASILDVGCGVGHLLDWLTERGFDGAYTGIEVQEEMAARARALHPEEDYPNARFECGEFLAMGRGYRADYVLASGIFPLADMELLKTTVAAMFKSAEKGLAFNCLSAFTPRREPPFFMFADPLEVFEYCTTLTKALLFRHDYLPQDFTVYLYKE